MKNHTDVEACVDDTLARVGNRVVLGIPLGLGKPNQLVNALYQRAVRDPKLELTIVTALSLSRPRARNELERRLLEPIVERVFGDWPELDYVTALDRRALPPNVQVREFYFQPGSRLTNARAQQGYTSSNYTHVVRDTMDLGLNVFAQLVSAPDAEGRYSLSCNPDLTLDVLPRLREKERQGTPVAVLAQVNPQLPFMPGDAALPGDAFDGVVEHPDLSFELFGPPNQPVSTQEYMIGLHTSALIRDDGTIQLGIGAMGDAICHLLLLRHERSERYLSLLNEAGALDAYGDLVRRVGGTQPFTHGLYASTEMLVDGLLDLYRAGVLKRRVEDGAIAHAGFFLGPRSFYQRLREMSAEERALFRMTSISFVNELLGDEELKRRQRRNARFVNSGMMVMLSGAAVSDGLEDGRVVSGVGGQHDFFTMAHALEDGRAILMLRSTRERDGRVRSNIVPHYGHTTIPRQLRDIVVSEYGIADLRGKSDAEVACALIGISDSRFQASLLRQAKRAGKIPRDYEIPDRHRANRPEKLERTLESFRREGLLPEYPQGTDLTDVEATLARALRAMQAGKRRASPKIIRRVLSPPEEASPYLERLRLDEPSSLRERVMRRVVLYALACDDALG